MLFLSLVSISRLSKPSPVAPSGGIPLPTRLKRSILISLSFQSFPGPDWKIKEQYGECDWQSLGFTVGFCHVPDRRLIRAGALRFASHYGYYPNLTYVSFDKLPSTENVSATCPHTQKKVRLCAHTHMNTIIWYHSITLTKLLLNSTSGWENLISPWREIILHRHKSVPETLVKPSRLKREKCHLSGIKHPQLQLRPWNMHRPDTYFSYSAERTTVSGSPADTSPDLCEIKHLNSDWRRLQEIPFTVRGFQVSEAFHKDQSHC